MKSWVKNKAFPLATNLWASSSLSHETQGFFFLQLPEKLRGIFPLLFIVAMNKTVRFWLNCGTLLHSLLDELNL